LHSIRLIALSCFVALALGSPAQELLHRDTLHRKWLTVGGVSAVGTGSLIGLNELWYKDYPRSRFHFFNDNGEWLQMDKAGHLMTTYAVSSILHPWFQWSGYNKKQSLLLSAGISVAYQTGIEVLDGYSSQWGFSNGDALCNLGGAMFFVGQEILWQNQKIRLKYSYNSSQFADLRPELLGESNSQRLLKDYNAQTYWMSANVYSFLPIESKFPKWINIAFGYGADGMTGSNTSEINGFSYDRYRQYYISFDVDLTKIDWPKKWMMSVARVLNVIKLPSPTVEFAVNRNFELFLFR